jgi:hypothetical protein
LYASVDETIVQYGAYTWASVVEGAEAMGTQLSEYQTTIRKMPKVV